MSQYHNQATVSTYMYSVLVGTVSFEATYMCQVAWPHQAEAYLILHVWSIKRLGAF